MSEYEQELLSNMHETAVDKLNTKKEKTNGDNMMKNSSNTDKSKKRKDESSEIDLGIGIIRLPVDRVKIKTERQIVGLLSYAELLGDENNIKLNERMTEYGLIGVLGPAREGKTALSSAISRLHDIPYYLVLEPYEGHKAVNRPSVTLNDAVRTIEHAIKDTTCDIVIIDSSRFINSVRSYGLAPGGTPTAYNIILTMLHNAAVVYGKLIILVISTMTNEAEHLALMRSMVIGSSLGLIEPSLLRGGGSISVRGGNRDFIDFVVHEPEFNQLCNISKDYQVNNHENPNISVLNNPKEILENQDSLNQDNLNEINEFQEFLQRNRR